MKEKTGTGVRLLQRLTDIYLALMLSVYLLWPGPGGYETITKAKFRLFLVLSVAWCGLTALLALAKKYRRAAAVTLGAALLVLAARIAFVPGLPGIFGEAHALLRGEADDSFGSGRVFIWRSVWQAVKERPLFGGGPDTLSRRVTAYFERYDETRGLVIRSGIDAAHNEYLNILANQGVLALLCWLGALGCSAVRFVRRGAESCAALLCGAAVLGYCVQALFGISMCLTTPYFLIAWAILENRRKEEQNQ